MYVYPIAIYVAIACKHLGAPLTQSYKPLERVLTAWYPQWSCARVAESLERCLLRCSHLRAGVWLRTVGRYAEYRSVLCPPYTYLMSYCTVHILKFICHVAQLVSCSTTFMSRSITRSTIFNHCVALGGVRSGVSSLRRTCCPLWSAWISFGFLSGSLRALRVCTYTHNGSNNVTITQ
jgi:hypothetical protein